MIAIIDYGMGNIHSVQKALQYQGAKVIITNSPAELEKSRKIVLPGVGAFDDAVSELKKRRLFEAIIEEINRKKTFLGICLGMQLLFEKSQESSDEKGLGALKGEVVKFPEQKGVKIPHIGWNRLKKIENRKSKVECPLLKGIVDNSYVYFCHSYYPVPEQPEVTAAITDYGIDFASVVWQDNVYGAQFHPEKSQETGLKILENFVKLC